MTGYVHGRSKEQLRPMVRTVTRRSANGRMVEVDALFNPDGRVVGYVNPHDPSGPLVDLETAIAPKPRAKHRETLKRTLADHSGAAGRVTASA